VPEIELDVHEQRETEMARDELAALLSFTSSARANNIGESR